MSIVKYKHARGTTEIVIGKDFLKNEKTWKFVSKKHVVFVYDKAISSKAEMAALQIGKIAARLSLYPANAGEDSKNLDQILSILSFLQKENTNRDSVLFVMGGGSLGDSFGFVASIYLRGISWCLIPTTLLAQVDSGIGGKTGLNLGSGKNLVGTFHQPQKVLIDSELITYLPECELISGFGEILKYAIAQDKHLFEELELFFQSGKHLTDLNWVPIIQRCVKIKAQTVQKDEFDLKGIREILNFGHTFGHALEAITSFKTFRHGEAVVWGMKFSVILSMIQKIISNKDAQRILDVLNKVKVPALPVVYRDSEIIELMYKDKKNRDFLRFVLVKKPGNATTGNSATESEIQRTLSILMTKTAI